MTTCKMTHSYFGPRTIGPRGDARVLIAITDTGVPLSGGGGITENVKVRNLVCKVCIYYII